MMNRLPHVRAPDGDPDVCVHCLEEWVDLLTLYETDECAVRLRAALDAERAAVVAWLRDCDKRCREWDGQENAVSGTYRLAAEAIERGEHRRKENE